MDYSAFDQIVGAINQKREKIHKIGPIRKWSHRITENIDEPNESLFTGKSETIEPAYTWSSARGNAWFWTDVVLPEHVEGISLAGSPVDFIFIFPIGSTIYLNGKQVYHEPFWSDTRAIELLIREKCIPGEKLQFVVKAKSGDGFGAFLDTFIRVASLDETQLELETFREQISMCRYLIEQNPSAEKESLLEKAIQAVDLSALAENDWSRWRESTKRAVEILMPFNDEAKSYEVNMIAHSHIDMNWLWPWSETVELTRRDFTSMDSLMTRFPDFRFSQSQVSVYKAMQDYHPDVFEMIKKRASEGKWEITASTWVEGDLNMAQGETLIRQILHSKRYLRNNFNMEPVICWEPDTFGHPATYPQILAKTGVKYYYFCRAGKGYPVFWWEAPDGSRVQAYNDLQGYGGTLNPESVVQVIKPMKERLGLKTAMKVYGVGDHGGAATARDIEHGKAVNDTPLLPKTQMSTVLNFHEKVAASGVEYPVVRDELNTIFEGCYSSHGDIKRLNRSGETGLLTAETLAALASIDAGLDYPIDALSDAWKNQCFHQFHDIICGCSIGSTYKEAAETLKPSQDFMKSIISQSASKLAGNVDTGSGEPKIVVFNQLAWQRTDIVEIDASEMNGVSVSSVKDESGNLIPAQILNGKLIFTAKDIPSLGCKVYLLSSEKAQTPIEVDEEKCILSNEFFRVGVNKNSGAIDSLSLKESNMEFAQPKAGWGPEGKINAGMLNRLQIHFEQPHPMSAWNIGDITRTESLISGAEVKVIETGPAVAIIEVRHKFLNSSLVQQIRVYAGLDRIDFVTEVDWHEKGGAAHDAPMLKATFTPYLGTSKAIYDIPFGTIERTANGFEVPALEWADISDAEHGITLANNCKYGHSAQGNTLALTLVRASYEPDNNPDEQVHNFTYSIVPHMGACVAANAMRNGSGLNQPLVGVVEKSHAGLIKPSTAMLSVDNDSVMISAIKFAEDQPNDGTASVIVRLFNTTGNSTKTALSMRWNVIKAEEADMLEEQGKAIACGDNSISLDFGGHEIKTIKLTVKN